MKQKQQFMALVKKEFFGFVNSPLAYMVIVPFLLLSHFLFFRTALVLGDANLRPFIELLPWFLVVLAPALAMRSFAEEHSNDTMELLFAHPLSEWVIVVAKFLGLWLFYGVVLASTAALPVALLVYSQPDIGLMVSQYVSAFLLGGVFLAVAMAVSTYIRSTVGSFLVGAALNFGLLLIGMSFVTLAVPAPLNRILIELGVVSHVNTLARGVLDLRDVLYFVTLIGLALTASVLKLSERKLAESALEKKKLQVILGLIVGIGVVLNLLMLSYPVRVDMTANQRFSLSEGTKQLLAGLPDRVTVTLYTSQNLPGPMQVVLRETSDRLKDFSRYGGERLRVNTERVDASDPEAQAEMQRRGIQIINFNQVGAGSYQVQSGLLGIEIRYGDETEVISFVNDASNLEYQLSRLILTLSRDELPSIGWLNVSEDPVQLLRASLSEQYDVTDLAIDENSSLNGYDGVIVVDDGSQANATAAAVLDDYVQGGGNGLFLMDGVRVSQELLTPQPSTSGIRTVVSKVGVQVNPDLTYDLQQNESIRLPSGEGFFTILPYPFWVRANVAQESVPWSGGGENVLLGWPSSLNLEEENTQYDSRAVLTTGRASGTQEQVFAINPNQLENLEPSGQTQTLGALVSNEAQHIGIIGDAQLVFDEFLQNSVQNQAFISNLIDWVAADELLMKIPQRAGGRRVFTFASTAQAQMVQYIAMIAPAAAVAGFGIWWLSRRRRLARRNFSGEL